MRRQVLGELVADERIPPVPSRGSSTALRPLWNQTGPDMPPFQIIHFKEWNTFLRRMGLTSIRIVNIAVLGTAESIAAWYIAGSNTSETRLAVIEAVTLLPERLLVRIYLLHAMKGLKARGTNPSLRALRLELERITKCYAQIKPSSIYENRANRSRICTARPLLTEIDTNSLGGAKSDVVAKTASFAVVYLVIVQTRADLAWLARCAWRSRNRDAMGRVKICTLR